MKRIGPSAQAPEREDVHAGSLLSGSGVRRRQPGPSTVRYGGNTVCYVETRLADGTLLVLDAGTGIRELGRELIRREHTGPITLLLTHVHWDHIQGLAVLRTALRRRAPRASASSRSPDVRSGTSACQKLILFDGIHFPIHARDIPAKLERLEDVESSYRVGSAKISRIPLNHPGGSQGFRIDDADGHSIAYLTDNEIAQPAPLTTTVDELARFSEGCDLVIHDAQYLADDMPAKRGWGHSMVSDVLELGKRAATPHLVLFHHEPGARRRRPRRDRHPGQRVAEGTSPGRARDRRQRRSRHRSLRRRGPLALDSPERSKQGALTIRSRQRLMRAPYSPTRLAVCALLSSPRSRF